MITWMQKHKKYLVITIWISVISFVAAGMVGWGAYNFSSLDGVANVGGINITAKELDREYGILFDETNKNYKKFTGKALDREQAKLLNLEQQALDRLISKALISKFALDSGMRVSNEEIALEIGKDTTFHESGSFSPSLYKDLLKRNGIRPSEYEDNVRKFLLLRKILNVFYPMYTPLEKEIISIQNKLQDRLELSIVNYSQIAKKINDDELKKFYEENKDSYKTKKQFEVELIRVKRKDIKVENSKLMEYYENNKSNYIKDGIPQKYENVKNEVLLEVQEREAKKQAYRIYNAFDNTPNREKSTLSEEGLDSNILSEFDNAKEGGVINPTTYENELAVFKVLKKIPQTIEPYDKVKSIVLRDYESKTKNKTLEDYGKAKSSLFKGRDVGYYSVNDSKPISNLNDFEKQNLLRDIFKSKNRSGYSIIGDKVILFRINDQRLVNNDIDDQSIISFKNAIIEQTIVEFLKTKYIVKSNFNRG